MAFWIPDRRCATSGMTIAGVTHEGRLHHRHGATRGIGAAIAKELAAGGARVAG